MRSLLICLTLAACIASAAPRITVHGHRGAPAVRPENTIPSFEAAIDAGADYIEMDVYATKDNVLVVAHDPSINMSLCQGSGGKRPVRSLTLEEIRQYDCGALKNASFPRQVPVPGTRIPTFDEVLNLATRNANFKFNVEIKSSANWKDLALPPDEISKMVTDAIRRHKLERRVLVQSFDFRVVKAMKLAAPEMLIAALYGPGERSFVDIAKETGVKMVNPNFKLVTAEKIKEAHAAGLQIVPWTVDTPEEWNRLIALGVDGIITNDPAALIAHLKAAGLR